MLELKVAFKVAAAAAAPAAADVVAENPQTISRMKQLTDG